MRLVTYRSERGERAGVLRDEVAVDAWDALGAGGTSVRELLAGDRLDELAGRIAGAEGLALDGVALCPPVPDPEKIICIGLNYREHAAEAGLEPPDTPTFSPSVVQFGCAGCCAARVLAGSLWYWNVSVSRSK